MNQFKQYYEVLQVNPGASLAEIHAAYRRLSHKYHPDVGGDEGAMKLLNEAYDVLGKRDRGQNYPTWLQSSPGIGLQILNPWLGWWAWWTNFTLYNLGLGWPHSFADGKTDDA